MAVSGVSNIDVNTIVSGLMEVERRPVALLDQKEAQLKTKLSAYGALKGAMSVFQGSMAALESPAKFNASTVNSSDSAVVGATAGSGAAVGTYDVEVTTLATSHVLKSAGVASDNTASTSLGTFTIQVGGGAIKTITLDASNNTLAGMRDAINAAGAGVSASIVHDGTTNRIVLTAEKSGTANTIQVVNSLSAGDLKDALDGLAQARPAANAVFKVNGVDISSDSNTVTSAVSGVTLTIAKAGTSKVVVARDTAAATGAVQSFVKAYNDLSKTITDLTKYDASTKKGSILMGDAAATGLLANIRSALGNPLTGLSGRYANLSQVGVSFQVDGSLSLDMNKLVDALKTSSGDVSALFSRQGVSSSTKLAYTGANAKTSPGEWHVDVSAAAARAAATGTNALAGTTVIDGTNNVFSLTVNGVATGNLTLAAGSYSDAQLATLVQNTLNGASPLSSAGIEVKATVVGGKLQIESQAYGTSSKVSAAAGSGAAALGFDGSETATGVNAAANFILGGMAYAATGNGQALTSATGGAVEGLLLKYTGTPSDISAGVEGTVKVSEGYAAKLSRLVEQALGTSGVVAARSDGINASIKDIGTRREALNTRFERVEKQLRAQYVALDTLMGRMSKTSNFLTQQLATMQAQTK